MALQPLVRFQEAALPLDDTAPEDAETPRRLDRFFLRSVCRGECDSSDS